MFLLFEAVSHTTDSVALELAARAAGIIADHTNEFDPPMPVLINSAHIDTVNPGHGDDRSLISLVNGDAWVVLDSFESVMSRLVDDEA